MCTYRWYHHSDGHWGGSGSIDLIMKMIIIDDETFEVMCLLVQVKSVYNLFEDDLRHFSLTVSND